jgi:hypothetical protein
MTSDPEDVGSGTSLTARSPELDFSLVLSRVIGSVKDDPAQLRNAVYELARFKLQREAWHRHPPMSFVEICRMMRAFESAIARVETVSAKHDEIKALQSLDRLIESWESSTSTMVLAPQAPMLVIDQTAGATADVEPVPAMPALPRRASPKHASSKHASPNHFRGWQWPGAAQLVRGVVVMVVAAALCVVLDRQFGLLGRHGAPATASVPATPTSKTADARLPAAPSVPTAPALPLPDVYGVYALNNGRLHELEALPGRRARPEGVHVDADQDRKPHGPVGRTGRLHRLSPRHSRKRARPRRSPHHRAGRARHDVQHHRAGLDRERRRPMDHPQQCL